jgi:hypothetical protein
MYVCMYVRGYLKRVLASDIGGHDVAFVHPRSATGVLLELVQAPADVIAHNQQ